jgi:glycosyltransferase involved in cell wall biosynthesis
MGWQGKRILLVGPLPPPAGGMANQTRQLAELLRGEGALVELVQTNAPCSPAWLGRVKGLRALARLLPYLWRLLVASGRNDLMHLMANSGWSWHLLAAPALCVARLRGLPVVVNYRGGGAAVFLDRAGWLVRPVMRLSTALIVPSGYLQQVFAGFGMPSQVVPNIVDLQRFRPDAQVAPEPAHLIVTRNLEPVYDNASAIRALALVRQTHPQARLTVAGSGPELRRLQALVQELGLQAHVHFTGRLDRGEMAALYGQAGVMLNPSLTDNMPNSVLEALASGVPVVSTDVGGVPFLLQEGVTGLLVPPAQPQALAQAVLRLLAEPALRARLVDNGLREAQRYTWLQVAPLLLGVYRQAQPAHRATAA